MARYTIPQSVDMNYKLQPWMQPLPSEDEMKEGYDKAKKEWANDKDLGHHSLAGKISDDYGKFENDILAKKAAGIELEGKEKFADTAINKVAPKAGDLAAGALVGGAAKKAGGKIIEGPARADAAKEAADKEVNLVKTIKDSQYSRFKSTIESAKKEFLDAIAPLDVRGGKPVRNFKDGVIAANGNKAGATKVGQAAIEANNAALEGLVTNETKRLLNASGASFDRAYRSLIEDTVKRTTQAFGSTIGTVMGLITFILSPLSAVSDKFEQKKVSDAKRTMIKKVAALNNIDVDVDSMSDGALDGFISNHKDEIVSWIKK